ncbi:hypothetical protein [Klebsiella variicola]|uniref:hypothetical protein n=1 Tax=Klebsiella variicola TaxID=244366 RepID=UPI001E3BB050|nr:hypothetical protein [Klebsiella variicola]MCD9773857.1 hypothetical protein [Klebsiella variicola subsp. variicola]
MAQQNIEDDKSESLVFSSDFPDDTPPKEALAANGVFFRITNRETPTRKCFLSDFEKDPDCVNTRTDLKRICSYGISLQDTIEGARETVGKFKNATIKRFIARGTLHERVGVEMQTFREIYHHTLWPYANVQLHTLFTCYEAVQK